MNRIARFELPLLAAVPLLAFWLMRFEPIAQNGFLDPYIYTGYIHNFSDLIDRFGVTYYSVRFGTLLPSHAATAVFGPIGGYAILRYLLALLAGIPYYALVRQRYGRATAIAMFLLLMTSPWLARTLLWDYTDATGVPFLFAGMCLFSLEHRQRRLLDTCAGLCLGMSIHSNVFALAPIGIYFGAYALLWVWHRRGVGMLVPRLLAIGAAIAVVSGAGALYYWVRVQRADIFTISFQTASELLGGLITNWRTPGAAWLTEYRWALNPVLLLAIGAIVCAKRLKGDFHEQVVWVSAVGIAVFYFGTQFLLKETFLQLFYYFSYALPVSLLMLASMMAALWERLGAGRQWKAGAILLAAATGPWVLRALDLGAIPPFRLYLAVGIVTLVIVAIASWATRHRAIPALLATATIGLVFTLSFVTMPFDGVVGRWRVPNTVEMDVYRTALRFIASVPSIRQQPGEMRFWYRNEPGSALQSIQSTYLWGYSKLSDSGPGMPDLGRPELEVIRNPRVKWLGLLARTESELASGRAVLLENAIPYKTIDRQVLTVGGFALHFERLDLLKRD